MNRLSSLPPASKLTVAALIAAAAGFVIQIISGIEVPTVPPGLVILLVAAGLVAFLPWWWIPVVGAAVGLFLLIGFFPSGAVGNLLDPSRLGVFAGAWVQFLAVITAAAPESSPPYRTTEPRPKEMNYEYAKSIIVGRQVDCRQFDCSGSRSCDPDRFGT